MKKEKLCNIIYIFVCIIVSAISFIVSFISDIIAILICACLGMAVGGGYLKDLIERKMKIK